ncbi:CvpA family protein [Patescibacteria group bacterium]|jgi:uncharacterized membrane protein required for colicin V production|uniref:CvpA family protein n=1 Tax=candidate division WWE3 bacterium TaxID=2053526 RepID=A0A928TVK6_UNCKA|nr:CvpA family protein [candidate division WWE3 bacterium]MCL4732283.1 CvpA family protein [Patescibacteria group bacterium]MDL1953182.1 CvpA family protein [Candidatus Uhrbacteria bacterium UHB]RIL00362.1 MAG: hypothetical protein DCC77_02230 [Candidatus Uhrbacteria bacterium]
MLILEILVLIVLIAFIANGYRSGAIETLGRVVGAVVGFIVARAYSGALSYVLASFLPEQWADIAAFIAIFFLVDQAIGMLFRLAERVLKILTRLPILKQLNEYLGAIFGFFEGVVIIGGISWVLKQSGGIEGTQVLNQLRVVDYIDTVFEKVIVKLL